MSRISRKSKRRKSDPKFILTERIENDARWQPEDDKKLVTAIEQVLTQYSSLNFIKFILVKLTFRSKISILSTRPLPFRAILLFTNSKIDGTAFYSIKQFQKLHKESLKICRRKISKKLLKKQHYFQLKKIKFYRWNFKALLKYQLLLILTENLSKLNSPQPWDLNLSSNY